MTLRASGKIKAKNEMNENILEERRQGLSPESAEAGYRGS
jgi:hypothetical protein